MTLFFEIITLLILSIIYSIKVFTIKPKTKSKAALRTQFITSYVILVLLSVIAGFLIYLHKKTRYIAKLRARRHIMNKLFQEINMADFPQGDLELYAGQYAVWFAVKLYSDDCKY
jgi:hypothetical protein